MKKTTIVGAALLTVFAGSAAATAVQNAPVYWLTGTGATVTPRLIAFQADPDTGCHYLVNLRGGITPRLKPDGTQVCRAPRRTAR